VEDGGNSFNPMVPHLIKLEDSPKNVNGRAPRDRFASTAKYSFSLVKCFYLR